MGTAGHLSHHVLVSRRRTHRRHPTLRRAVHWPVQHDADAATAANEALAAEGPLAQRLSLGAVGAHAVIAPSQAAALDLGAAGAERAPSVLDMPLAQLHWRDPFHWLALGWRDFSRAPLIGLFYGAAFVVMGWLLLACFKQAPEYTLALSAGFLLMGPFLCLGLYEASRALSQGRRPSLWASLTAWRASSGQLAIFAGVLLVMEMLWGRAALIVFAISFDGMPDFSSLASLLNPETLTFIATYMAVGAVFAGLIYAMSVISMPMILDQSVDAISAGLASMRLVSTQTGVMLLWAGLITGLIALAMLPGFMGLLVAGPVLGHASWHAYCAAVKAR
jgi:uncharacterized membrane protein